MFTGKRTLYCMDCGKAFTGHFDGESDLILCDPCKRDFKRWLAPHEDTLGYTLFWHREFIIRQCGNRGDRRNAWLSNLLDELLA